MSELFIIFRCIWQQRKKCNLNLFQYIKICLKLTFGWYEPIEPQSWYHESDPSPQFIACRGKMYKYNQKEWQILEEKDDE